MPLHTTLPAIISSALVVCLFSFLWRLGTIRRRFRGLPIPPHSFLFGHIRLLFGVIKQLPGSPPLGTALSLIQSKYELPDVFYMDLWPFVPEPFLVTSNLSVADRFLNDYTRHPGVLGLALQPLVGGERGLVSSNLPEWHDSRAAIRGAFSVTNVQRFLPDIAQYSMHLRAELLQRAKTDRRFPLIDLVEKWGADLTFRFLVGEDTAVQNGGWGVQTNADVQAIIAQVDSPVSWNPWTRRQRKEARARFQVRVRNRIREALDSALERREPAAHNKFMPVLDLLVAKYVEDFPESTEWQDDLVAQHLDTVMTMFLAADVSSMYVFYHITQDTTVAATLRKEHNNVFPGDAQAALEEIRKNPSKIKQLHYTTAVIKESMRLRPPGLSGTTAPKGHVLRHNGIDHDLGGKMLMVNAARLQTNETYISSPLTFDPSRWLPNPDADLANTWRPFQRGQHSCMGENMMMPGLVIALLMTVRDIDIALAYDDDDARLSPEFGGAAYMDGMFAAKPAKGLPATVKALTR
ncbi:hypothetical protein QQS21_005631 [Conoideocrella luteorostrata]|uniref:Cytochrome P450 n=1 Tax=Conoideocrella luteorostrata TaxID=1105319 RepID=A0AAJ0CS15_9HYPO|nr:hypothetical protein QQS21_005631 [Conoideocrella luteorostrata]